VIQIGAPLQPSLRIKIALRVSRDGPYFDLLTGVRATWPETQFVVMLCTGEWEKYLQAMRFGAQEVLRCPLRPTDITS